MNHARIFHSSAAAAVVVVSGLSAALHAQPPLPAPSAAPATQPSTRPATGPSTQPAKFSPDHVIIQVGEEQLTVAEFEALIDDLPPQQQMMLRGPRRRELAENLVQLKLLAKEAGQRGIDQTDKFKRQMAFIRQQVLANALVSDVQEKVDDAAVKEYFEKHKKQFEQVAARHVLIRTPGSRVPLRPGEKEMTDEQAKAKAQAIAARIRKGEDFAAIAKAESDDTGSGAEGGDLGRFGRGRMVPAFEEAVFSLKEGEVSNPVQTPFGYHVIQLTNRYDTLEKLGESADEVRETIRGAIGPERMNDLVEGLKKKTDVKLDDAYFGPAMPDLDALRGAFPPPSTRPATEPEE